LATISAGAGAVVLAAPLEALLSVFVMLLMAFSGFAKSCSTCEACFVAGVMARRLVGRSLRRSRCVGIDSGMGSDMFFSFSFWSCVFLFFASFLL
jgi:hypothetical protein